ncbi:MAG TPA: HNH endonuclease signature motif containing protein [Anaerolineae bacterium]|nr:HNH endonuclease signature motif containing protein [Anaerolineae bacterium]
MLWGRAASRCAFPECRRQLVVDATQTDDESLVGDACHIIAREPSGPRGDCPLPPEDRDRYDNLILLCKVHHKLVDDQPLRYTAEVLKDMKALHERWVSENLPGFDAGKQRDDELYAEYVDHWVESAGVDHWREWASGVLAGGQPSIAAARYRELQDLRLWLFSRVWPRRYRELEAAFENFLHTLSDFVLTFDRHVENRGAEEEKVLWTKKFYKIGEWDPPRYERLVLEYNFHVDLVEDLMLELTRAANYVCDTVRQLISPSFRLSEGVILVESGPYEDLRWRTHRTEYRDDERVPHPYPGLEKFKSVRKSRNMHFGEGVSIDEPDSQPG